MFNKQQINEKTTSNEPIKSFKNLGNLKTLKVNVKELQYLKAYEEQNTNIFYDYQETLS